MTQNVVANKSMTIGQRIKVARGEAGLSITRLARELDVDPRTVARWQSDHVTPSIDRVLQIAALTQKPPEFFFSEIA
jgi:transcriptional regulator with XRE-family HTH domain